MASLVSSLAGIVQVPLYDNGFVAGAGFNLDNSSYGPFLQNFGQALGTTTLISSIVGQMPMVGGLAQFLMGTPNAPGFASGSNVSYFDGYIHHRNTSSLLPGGTQCLYHQAWKPRPGITVTGVNYLSPLTDTFTNAFKIYLTGIFPATYRSQKAEASIYNNIGTDHAGVTVRVNNGFVSGGNATGGDPGPSLFNIILFGGHNQNGANICFNRMTAGSQSLTSYLQGMDNCAVITAGHTFGDTPAKVVWCNSFFPNASVTYDWHLDNAALELQWTFGSFLNIPGLFVYPYGFIATILMNGAGPTGQKWETLVFNSDCTLYYLIKWVPQDANSILQMNSANPHFVAIDEQGIVWMTAGAPISHLSSSFSPTGFFIPILQAPPLNPFVLPCYSTCSPVSLINH